jgi:cation diffusion facilitator family transporter
MEQNEKIAVYSIGVNLVLVGIKGLLSFFSGSVALMADATHSASDVVSSATVLAGIKISKRKSINFPYGLYKVENFVSLLSSIFIFLAGYEIIQTVFFEPQSLKSEYLPYAMAGVVLAMGITFAFSRYELKQGKKIGSPSLIADAKHIRTDMLSSAVILVGLVGSWLSFNLDKIAAILVVILVFKAGISIFVDSLRVLLDASIDFGTMDKVKSIIMNENRVVSINTLLGRNSGSFKFIEVVIVLKVKNLEKAHAVSQRIENEIKHQVFHVDKVLIHFEPHKKETTTYAVPLKEDKQGVSEHFGDAPYFYLATVQEKDRSILSERYDRNPFTTEEKGKGIMVSEWLLEKDVDSVISPRGFEGKGPSYVFSDADVEIILTKGKTLEEIRRLF